ncbi:FtsX-like permease family protein [Actinacidiphila glaucinigra]|uniref:FtsX-like permease family protein n=1 Tax=Actinacidiphila glaucinigra TaxID=235986 RepID=A0A239P093_9ACTN|nr:FtsX-like permease family protein [Actinacidiphila glaucinigra]SNT60506.1 FtsX-like permease family protein [Actinacidiphila glaucinigra]
MVPGFVLLRLRAHRLLLAAALLSVVLTTCAVAALAAFSGAVGDAGLRRALQGPSAARTQIDVTSEVTDQDTGRLESTVRRALTGAYDGLPVRVSSSTRSGAYGLPRDLRPAGASPSDNPDLTLLATFDRARVTMVEGAFPAAPKAAGPVPVALPESAAEALGVTPGDVITLADRRGGPSVRVRLTGLYRPADPAALYWRLDPLEGRGVRTLSFTTYGPMLVDPRAFAAGAVPAAEVQWTAGADFSAMTTARLDRVGQDVRRTVGQLDGTVLNGETTASSQLPALADDLSRNLLVSRSTLLISALQLAVLAGLALMLVAGLLATERSEETAQLRARGGSRSRIAGLAATEAVLLALPAAVLAPLLTGPLVRLLAGHGALARADVHLDVPTTTAWWAGVLAALACAVAVASPALRRTGTYAGEREARSRKGALPGAVQAGTDLALLLVAGLGYWQLSRRDGGTGALTTDTAGALSLDPVLIVAPAICLLAGAVLALRLLPLAARLGERLAAGSRGLPTALAGWQLSRRTGRGAVPALLLVLAVSISMFAIGENASWERSQRDQADFTVGADVRVAATSTLPFGQGGVYDHVPGIAAVTPANRSTVPLPRGREATVLSLDTTAASRVTGLRDDLTDRPFQDLLRSLRPQDIASRDAGFTLPEGTARLLLTVRLQASDFGGRPTASNVTTRLSATFTDRFGVPYTMALGKVPADGGRHVVVADFAAEAGRAPGAGPAGPLRLTTLKADYVLPQDTEHHRLSLVGLRAVSGDGSAHAVPVPGDSSWQARATMGNPDFTEDAIHLAAEADAPRSDRRTPLTVEYDTGQMPPGSYWPGGYDEASVIATSGPKAPATLTGVATDSFLRAVDAKVGDPVRIQLAGVTVPVRVTAAVRALPTATARTSDTDGGALLLDLRSVNTLLNAGRGSLVPGEWWLAAEPGATARVASALRARGDITSLLVRDEQRTELQRDPLGAGPLSALPAAVVTAAVLAAVGYIVAAAGALRERSQEFAMLRALGTPRRWLARVIAAEQGLLVLVAVGVGAVLGGLLTRLVVPLIILTAHAENPVPEVRVELPSGPLVLLLITVTVLPLLGVMLTAWRSADPAQALRRQGGE